MDELITMGFLSEIPDITFKSPLFCGILGNTVLSTIPGVSGAGATPEKTLLTPVLDAELITWGAITSYPIRPDTPTGCPTPASITRAMMELCDMQPLFINAGLCHTPTVPCLDVYGMVGDDPRFRDAVPRAHDLLLKGEVIGKFLSKISDLLVLGECVPGGTTTALCKQSGNYKRRNLPGSAWTNQSRCNYITARYYAVYRGSHDASRCWHC
jgi:NaMN:DMB phosphoribosyltransferase